MNHSFARFVCRILAVCMIGLPFQAHAGMIGTDQAVSPTQAQLARDAVAGLMNRADVARQLQSFGITPQAAKDRVAALTDAEAVSLAGRIDGLPAGAGGPSTLVLILLIFVFYWFVIR